MWRVNVVANVQTAREETYNSTAGQPVRDRGEVGKAPAYQRYAKQILGDDVCLAMDWDAYGMHNWLLDISWQQDPPGTIPNDQAVIRRWLRNPSDDVWRRVWPQLMPAWLVTQDGRLGNAGMMRTAERQRNYSNGNRGKGAAKQYANSPQIECKPLPKNTTDEGVVVQEVSFLARKAHLRPADFPEDSDKRVREIASAHPRFVSPAVTHQVIVDALEEEAAARGSYEAAMTYLLERTRQYAKLTKDWPRSEHAKVSPSHKWFAEGRFRESDAMWERGKEPENASSYGRALRELHD